MRVSKSTPTTHVTDPRALSKRVAGGLSLKTCSDAQITAALNLLYRIMAGNGTLSSGESVETPLGTLTARSHTATIMLQPLRPNYLISARFADTQNMSAYELMQVGAFMGALRALGDCDKVDQGVTSEGNSQHEQLTLGFQSKGQLIKSINALAAQFPAVTMFNSPDAQRSAESLLAEIASQVSRER